MTTIYNTLRPLGLSHRYKGFQYLAYAISLAIANRDCLCAVTKEIYMATADHFGCVWSSVERNVRTVVAHAWRVNPDLLAEMAGYPLSSAPAVTEFIEIVSYYILHSSHPQL